MKLPRSTFSNSKKKQSARNVLIGKVNLITENPDEELASPILTKNHMSRNREPLQSLQDKMSPVKNIFKQDTD